MLQAIEAEISPDGQVTLLEPVHLAHRARAVVTILSPIDESLAKRGSGEALLGILDSADFVAAEPGDAERNAWSARSQTIGMPGANSLMEEP